MENNLNELIGKLADFLKTETKTETVIGQQFQLGEFTCVPVIGVGFGIGAGGGEGTDPKQQAGSGAGGGAGMSMAPVGFLVTYKNQIQFVAAGQPKGIGMVMEKLPDLLSRLFKKS